MYMAKIRDARTVMLIDEAKTVQKMMREGLGYMDDDDMCKYIELLHQRIGEMVTECAILGEEQEHEHE